jgi:hypothetical protein
MKFHAPRILIAAATALAALGLAAPPAHAATATSISFTSATTAQIGTYNWLSVSVGSADGTRPEGGVQFFNSAGQIVGTASTSPSGANGATASIPWVPTQQTTYTFTATFLPSNPALASSTTGAPITVQATPNGQLVSIAATQMYKGVPTTLTATVFPSTLTGSVAFSANYAVDGISPSLPLVNGTASYTFTPGSTGWQQFIVSFTSTTNPVVQGAVSQWVNVLLPLGTDDISLNPQPATMANGTTITLNATTVGGGASTLTAAGGCTLAGTLLTATTGNGLCTVTGTSAASGAYLGATESWPIALVPGTQTATIVAPKSGTVRVGRTITLASSSARTNAGKKVSWAVVTGASRCQLSVSSGRVRLTFAKSGTCSVRGSAPAIAGEWNAYRVSRTYNAR